jgi:hypothetical protein
MKSDAKSSTLVASISPTTTAVRGESVTGIKQKLLNNSNQHQSNSFLPNIKSRNAA